MNYFQQILENPILVILSVMLVIYAIKEGYELFKWWKSRAQDYHKAESNKEDFVEQVKQITVMSQDNAQALSRISSMVEGTNDRLAKAVADRNKILAEMEARLKDEIARIDQERRGDISATGRILLYQFYEKLKDKDEITAGELEAFNAIAERCIEAGVNGVFKGKIIPFIRSKPVEGR